MMGQLESVTDANWQEFTSHALAVLMVGESDCPACKAWTEELTAGLATDELWGRVRFGKVTIDTASTEDFRKNNQAWLEMIEGVPFNVIYVGGEPQTSFYGGGIERLWKRLKRLNEENN